MSLQFNRKIHDLSMIAWDTTLQMKECCKRSRYERKSRR